MGTKPTDERGKEAVEGWRQRRPRDIAINEFYFLKASLRSIALQDCALTMTMVKVSFLLLCQSPQGNCHQRKNGLFWRRPWLVAILGACGCPATAWPRRAIWFVAAGKQRELELQDLVRRAGSVTVFVHGASPLPIVSQVKNQGFNARALRPRDIQDPN